MYVYTDILLYIYCIYDIYLYNYIYICICTQMLSLHVIQATPFGESPRLSEWETTIGMLGRRSLEGYHCTCQSEQSLGSNGGQHLYDISVIFLKNSPNLGSRKKNRIHDMSIRIYIYYVFFWVEGFRIMFSASNLRTTYPEYFHPTCGFHIDSLCSKVESSRLGWNWWNGVMLGWL